MKLINEVKKMVNRKIEKLGKITVVQKVKYMSAVIGTCIATVPVITHAAVDAEAAWASTIEAIQPWVLRLGVVLLVFGGIEFAIAQQNEDAAQKTRSGRFMISGAACIGVAIALFPLLTQ